VTLPAQARTRPLSGWGRVPVRQAEERVSEDLEAASDDVPLTRGLGRSYGDASLPGASDPRVLCSRLADRVIALDRERGVLRAEAGLSLARMNALLAPAGLATPVSPGTQYVTLGGMVASDVHGKNHHVAGCFGEHVRALRMRVADGRVLEVTDDAEPELFRATLGGLGLTGHVLEVEVALERISSPWIWRETRRLPDLDGLIDALCSAGAEWPFTVGWVDTTARGGALGRGLLTVGRWALPEETPPASPRALTTPAVPFDMPEFLIAPWSIALFNQLWFHRVPVRGTRGVVHPVPFFTPLDAVRDWNRLYGKRGMVQYQCVLPIERDPSAPRRVMETVVEHGGASPLSVVKECGPEGRGLLSFPMPGVSIALDLPYRGGATQALIDALNEIVIDCGGRIYLAKDALTRRDHLQAMESRLAAFEAVRRRWDPERRLRSALSTRLLGDGA
jgi:FAD/FMN-containing dehydrogenase